MCRGLLSIPFRFLLQLFRTWARISLTFVVAKTLPGRSSIAACRAVIRLMEFNGQDVYVQSMGQVSHAQIRSTASRPPKYTPPRPEIHVTTEAITVAEFPYVECF